MLRSRFAASATSLSAAVNRSPEALPHRYALQDEFSGIVNRQLATRSPFPALYLRCRGCRNTQLRGYCQIGSKTIPRRRNSARGVEFAPFLTSFSNLTSAGEMRRILLSTIKILISAALLYFSLRKVNLSDLASRINVGEPGLDRPGDRRDLPADLSSACCAGARSARNAARRSDQAGDALQPDRNVLQPDAAVLDRRRRGAAVAGRARRRRLARGDLFHLRRSRHRPDRAGDHHRREPAMELQPDRRSARPLGAAAGRFRRARGRSWDFWCLARCPGRG